ncbi:hypothetical protein GH714_037372 [Hevea brasiliensis]|uniref:7,8-dihydroneopterin aldolase n=1 Tax=Hevea brasiliensis TaxID=3981 RepID=A0A6A6KMT6_HEVBR|nr:hypothetical protein GH714_037372 [Hevea brasiliensis]
MIIAKPLSSINAKRDALRHKLMCELTANEVICRDIVRMGPVAFAEFCGKLKAIGLLKDFRPATMEEQVAKFLHISGQNFRNCALGFFFHRSDENLITEVDRELMHAKADHHVSTSALASDADYRIGVSYFDVCEQLIQEKPEARKWMHTPINNYDKLYKFYGDQRAAGEYAESAREKGTMENDELIWGDKLILRGLKFHGFHGVKPEEKTLGQKFLIDVDAWMDLRAAGKSDQLSDTLSYTEIYRLVKEVVEGPPHNLLESVAQQIASTTLTKYPQISAVRVKVGKPHVAVHGPLDYLGVEIFRRRIVDVPN